MTQTIALCITSFHEMLAFLIVKIITPFYHCLYISTNAAYGGFQLMGNILGELMFEPCLFFHLSNIINRYLKTVVEEDHTRYQQNTALLVYRDRSTRVTAYKRTVGVLFKEREKR